MIVSVKSPEGMMDGESDPMPEDSVDAGDPIQVELMEMLKDFVKKISEKMSTMEQNYSSLQNEFNVFKKEPAGKKISDGKTEFNKISGESADDKFNALMAFREINKK
jgi:hypothetical protein